MEWSKEVVRRRVQGVDATHNPEFTSVEAYLAYGDYTVRFDQ